MDSIRNNFCESMKSIRDDLTDKRKSLTHSKAKLDSVRDNLVKEADHDGLKLFC